MTKGLLRGFRLPAMAPTAQTVQDVLARVLPGGAAEKTLPAGTGKTVQPGAGLPGAGKTLDVTGILGRLAELPGLDKVLPSFPANSPVRRRQPGEPAQPPGAAFLHGSFSGASGTRPYRLYVPANPAHPAPLVVMLHGCTQTAEDFAAGTRMNAHAEAEGALVLYPVQLSSANAQRCWNWFNPADQQRDSGEPSVIAGMIRQVMGSYDIDPDRIFVAGLSAGGAQAAVMARAYPDLIAAIGVHSGLACGAATDMVSAFSAMNQGRAGQGRHDVPTIIFHGDVDRTVNLRNAAEVANQAGVDGAVEVEQGGNPGGLAYTRRIRRGADGRVRSEQWTVHGAGHAWSGGSAAGSYTEPAGPDASQEMMRFFLGAAPIVSTML